MVAASLLQGPRHQSRKQSASNVGPVVVRGRFVCPCWGVALYCCFWMCGGPARVNGGDELSQLKDVGPTRCSGKMYQSNDLQTTSGSDAC